MADHDDRDRSGPHRSAWRFRLFSLFVLIAIAAISIRSFQIWRARAHTAAELAKTTSVEFLDTPLGDILNAVGIRSGLRFQTELPDAERLVTYDSQAPLSQVLDEMLHQHECEYSVMFDGTILVSRRLPE